MWQFKNLGRVSLLVGLLSCASSCSERTAEQVKLLDYGLYDATLLTKGSPALGQPISIVSVAGLQHRETTTSVPCAVGTSFGLRLDPNTLASRFDLKTEIEHPPFTPPGGAAPESKSVHEYEGISASEYDGTELWHFVEGAEYELVPGVWSFRVYIDGLLVAEKNFNVGS